MTEQKEQKPEIIERLEMVRATTIARHGTWGNFKVIDEVIKILEKSLKRDEQREKAIKMLKSLQIVGLQSDPSDERGAGYKLGSLNICDLALKALEEG